MMQIGKALKRINSRTLGVLFAMPILVVFLVSISYTSLENHICASKPEYAELCNYPERLENEKVIRTNLYRNYKAVLGGDDATGENRAFSTIIESIGGRNDMALTWIFMFNILSICSILLSGLVALLSLKELIRRVRPKNE